jgi:hypothetical protein
VGNVLNQPAFYVLDNEPESTTAKTPTKTTQISTRQIKMATPRELPFFFAGSAADDFVAAAEALKSGAGFPSEGKTSVALSQSVQPSRQTSESDVTRPSVIHFRITSPRAGPN